MGWLGKEIKAGKGRGFGDLRDDKTIIKQSCKGILKDRVSVNSQLVSTYVLLWSVPVPGVHLSHLS